eukprot:SAG22_NODE_482_length_9931_cov_9.247254_2_plen_46_part_00
MITHEDPPSSKALAKAKDFAGRVSNIYSSIFCQCPAFKFWHRELV